MPVLGTGSFLPNSGFAFTRPYVMFVEFGFGPGVTHVGSGPNFYFTDGSNPNIHVVANLKPSLFALRTNSLTLDYVLVDWWLLIDPNPNPQPLNYNVLYRFDPTTHRPGISIYVAGWSVMYRFPIPLQPQPYWLPSLPP